MRKGEGKSQYAMKRAYLAKLSKRVGYRVWGFQIKNKVWKKQGN